MKVVSFNENNNKVYLLIKWNYAYKNARKRYWECFATDRLRFARRIHLTAKIINPVLEINHRYRVYKERFENKVIF